MTTVRRLSVLSMAVATVAWMGGCATPPPASPPPAAPAPVAAAPAPAEPVAVAAPSQPEPAAASPAGAQQAQRLANTAAELLEVGNEEQALNEIQRALQADPANRLAQSLLKQIQTDPQTLLGREHFSYRVEPGESLSRIAGRFLKDVHLFYALARYNDIKVPRQLQGGQVIKVPGKQPAPPPAPAPAPVTQTPPAAAPAAAPARPSATEAKPTPAEAIVAQEYRKGLALMAQQKPAEAIQAFDKVLEREPSHANAKLKRAQAVGQVGGLVRLLENTIKRLDGQLAQNPGNAALKAERDKAVADRDRLLTIK
jgi:tetratricopeptide (TPR) repeat protein